FGEPNYGSGDLPSTTTNDQIIVDNIEKELINLSSNENKLFDQQSSLLSWSKIEQGREQYFQTLMNNGIHLTSKIIGLMSDSSQIDDSTNVLFDRHIQPFIFELIDHRQFVQLIVHFLHFLNGLPLALSTTYSTSILNELLSSMKISLSSLNQEQLFIQTELTYLWNITNQKQQHSLKTEQVFSYDFINRVYQQIITLPSIKNHRIDFILLYWYYLASNLYELKQQNATHQYKIRLKTLQLTIKKYLSLDEYRTCLRLYTHYARLECEYLKRPNECKRLLELCFETIKTGDQSQSFENSYALCHWLVTYIFYEYECYSLFDRMFTNILNKTKVTIQSENNTNLLSIMEYIFYRLFQTNQLTDIMTLVQNCFRTEEIKSKWDQKSVNDWASYLRTNMTMCIYLFIISLCHLYITTSSFVIVSNFLIDTILPLFKKQQQGSAHLDLIIKFYLCLLWRELFNKQKLTYGDCTSYLKNIFDNLNCQCLLLLKFSSIYTIELPLYNKFVRDYEQQILSFKNNPTTQCRLISKTYALIHCLLRHLKIKQFTPTINNN
ncbi:unnamed protein product, partial [Didymodactylos carnosus]